MADAPEVKNEPNDIEKTLSSLGVQYTHRNDDLIAESAIEGQRMQKLVEVCTRYWIPSLDLVPL